MIDNIQSSNSLLLYSYIKKLQKKSKQKKKRKKTIKNILIWSIKCQNSALLFYSYSIKNNNNNKKKELKKNKFEKKTKFEKKN